MPRASAPSAEPQVRAGMPVPPGYVFVPKGDVYVTSNCRRRTHEAQRTVYTVVGADARAKPPPLGILVPRSVACEVRAAERATRADRARAVARRDAGLERRFRDVVAREFPRAPPAEVPAVVARATRKGSRRVGRTATLDVEVRARLAVRAHIRHQHTDYDDLLKRGTKKAQARRLTFAKIEDVVRAWGGQALPSKQQQGKSKERSQAKKPDRPKVAATVQDKETPTTQQPGSSAVRTQKQLARAAKRRQRKDRKRQERQARGNAVMNAAASNQAPPVTPATSTTWVTPTTWNWAPPASGTADAPICIEDDEPEFNEYNQGYEDSESDEYAWHGTDNEFDSVEAEGEDDDDYDSETAEDVDDVD